MVGVAYLWTSNLLLALFFLSGSMIREHSLWAVITLGKHRLFERISPKKSWEGFFGDFSSIYNCGVAVLAVRYGLFGFGMVSDSCWFAIGFAVTVTVFGTWGDLVESLLKRTLKDKRFRQHYSGSRRHTRQNRFLPSSQCRQSSVTS